MIRKVILAAVFVFTAAFPVLAQDVYSSSANDEIFNAFETKLSSYENALVLVVQTYAYPGKMQTIEEVKVKIGKAGDKDVFEQTVKTPYMYVIADYADFKSKIDFATSNAKRDLVESHKDTTYIVRVDADIKTDRTIFVSIADQKKNIVSQSESSFPFVFAAACKTRYADIVNNVDPSIDNTPMDIKDYYSGPKVISK